MIATGGRWARAVHISDCKLSNAAGKCRWDATVHAETPRCHLVRNLAECIQIGTYGSYHPTGFVHQLMADTVVSAMLPAMKAVCSTDPFDSSARANVTVPPLPSPLRVAANLAKDPVSKRSDLLNRQRFAKTYQVVLILL